MRNQTNVTGAKHVKGAPSEMSDFDSLPEPIRMAISGAPYRIRAGSVKALLEKGLDPNSVVTAISLEMARLVKINAVPYI